MSLARLLHHDIELWESQIAYSLLTASPEGSSSLLLGIQCVMWLHTSTEESLGYSGNQELLILGWLEWAFNGPRGVNSFGVPCRVLRTNQMSLPEENFDNPPSLVGQGHFALPTADGVPTRHLNTACA